MTPEAEHELGSFFRELAADEEALLLLDYDGTLAPFQVDRFQAVPWAGVRELLTMIQRQGKTRMAVITGRPAAEIAPLLDMDAPLEVWGLHGAERLFADGRRELDLGPEAVREKLDELRERLRRDSLGGLFEDKPNAAVMHWRGVPSEEARLIEQRTRALFEPLAGVEGFALLKFEAGLELRAGRDKSAAVETLLEEMRTGVPAAYLGDDITDEAAFRALKRRGLKGRDLTVLVRPEWRETAAEVWLRPPEELKAIFERWIAALGS